MYDSEYIREKKSLVTFYVKLVTTITSLLFFLFFCIDYSNENEILKSYKDISSEQQQLLLKQLGSSGLRSSISNGCYSSLTIRITTGKWNDEWCASIYGHLNFKTE